jgi:hypothetical protein
MDSFWGVALVFVGVIGAAAIIANLNSTGGQKNVSTGAGVITTSIGDAFKAA